MAKKETIITDTKSAQELNREMKTIRNWEWFDKNTSANKERDIITAGKSIDTGKIKGIITKIEGNIVYIENSETGKVENVSIKDALKGYKTPKAKKDIVANISIEGPIDSNRKAPEVGKSFAPSLDAKSTKANDQKLSNKINTISSVKSFSDLAKDFDSSTIKSSKKSVSTEISGKATKKDDTLFKANTQITFVKSFSDHTDLQPKPSTTKFVRSKENEIAKNIDNGKASKSEDNKITKKITKIKSFSELNSKVQTGPNK